MESTKEGQTSRECPHNPHCDGQDSVKYCMVRSLLEDVNYFASMKKVMQERASSIPGDVGAQMRLQVDQFVEVIQPRVALLFMPEMQEYSEGDMERLRLLAVKTPDDADFNDVRLLAEFGMILERMGPAVHITCMATALDQLFGSMKPEEATGL